MEKEGSAVRFNQPQSRRAGQLRQAINVLVALNTRKPIDEESVQLRHSIVNENVYKLGLGHSDLLILVDETQGVAMKPNTIVDVRRASIIQKSRPVFIA